MIYTSDFSWIESYLLSENVFFEDVVAWEDALSLLIYDMGIFFWLNATFENTIILTDVSVKLTSMDIVLINDFQSSPLNPFLWFIMDISLQFTSILDSFNYFFISDYQDLISLLQVSNPELLLAIFSLWDSMMDNMFFDFETSARYDSFTDSINHSFADALMIPILALFFFAIFSLLFNGLSNASIFKNYNWEVSKLSSYFFSIAQENRIQFDAMLHTLFLVLFYWIFLLMSFDDDYGDLLEFGDSLFLNIFLFLMLFLVCKYSIHYFAFLEASDISGRSVLFLLKQFFRDFMGSLGLFLRFLILIFRLNVYDNLDDILDSYYIVIGDFDDDTYVSDQFMPFESVSFIADYADDRSLHNEEELDSPLDFFSLYFLLFAKLVLFLFFILEEIFRVSLALYISYLILFEVHAANASSNESNYFISIRTRFKN